METIFKFIYEFHAEDLYALLNSQFSSSILGALAGAFAAHKIASSAKKREEIEIQLRAVNVAISSAFLICNATLGLKRQQIETLYKDYMADRANYENALMHPPAGGPIQISKPFICLICH